MKVFAFFNREAPVYGGCMVLDMPLWDEVVMMSSRNGDVDLVNHNGYIYARRWHNGIGYAGVMG